MSKQKSLFVAAAVAERNATVGREVEARREAAALAERCGADTWDDSHEFIDDVVEMLLRFDRKSQQEGCAS